MKKSVFTTVALTGASVTAFLGLELKRRKSPVFRINKAVLAHLEVGDDAGGVVVVSTCEEWQSIVGRLKEDLRIFPVIGLDCEWVSVDGVARPVALLQIAAFSGLCILVRLNLLDSIPSSLKEVLADHDVFKVGVAILDDSHKLLVDYSLDLIACLDLRHLLLDFQCRTIKDHPGKLGLESLAYKILGVKLDKDWKLRGGDWEAEVLSERQIRYAANDALVAVNIFWFLLRDFLYGSVWSFFKYSFTTSESLQLQLVSSVEKYVDLKFNNKDWKDRLRDHKEKSPSPLNKKARFTTVRKSPLYHNCMLQAPDGQLLCTCDTKKAKWYVSKDIGVLISEDPMIVRLRFEPSGRPEGKAGEYYLSVKPNICVVCGKEESYLRKSVVPHEYRRYFPAVMKDHQSHDVLLMCVPCHQRSNMHDASMRRQLAEECNAPIGTETDVKLKENFLLKQVRSAGRALQADRARGCIPIKRKEELQAVLKEHYKVEEISDEVIDAAAAANFLEENGDYVPHSRAVVQYYLESNTSSLLELEKKWRRHFLDTMKPQHLPELWSVEHQAERLEVKAKENRIDLEQYKLAKEGVGEGDNFDLEAYRCSKQAQLGINPDEVDDQDFLTVDNLVQVNGHDKFI